MSRPDRSWTIAPVLLWFAGALGVALCLVDGGVGALADRFRAHREPPELAPAGPVFTKPVIVAEAPDTRAPATDPMTPGPIVASDRSKILALEDFCVDDAPSAGAPVAAARAAAGRARQRRARLRLRRAAAPVLRQRSGDADQWRQLDHACDLDDADRRWPVRRRRRHRRRRT